MIKVNELYYPVEVDVNLNIGVSGAFRYEHFDRYGDRKGESDWIKNSIETGPRDGLKAAIAQQAIGYSTLWSDNNNTIQPDRICISNSSGEDCGTGSSFSGPVQNGSTVTWTVEDLECALCVGSSYTPTISLKDGGVLVASATGDIIGSSAPEDTFDLTYTFSFTYNEWNANSPFLQNVCDGNATSKSNNTPSGDGIPWIGSSAAQCLLSADSASQLVSQSSFKIFGKTSPTTLALHLPAGSKASYNRFGVGPTTGPWFYGTSTDPFTGLDNKRVKVQVTWTVG